MTPFQIDEEQIRRLARLLYEVGLGEIEIESGKQKLRLVRDNRPRAEETLEQSPVVVSSPAVLEAEPVLSPMVGTAFLASEPQASPFVAEGQVIVENQTLLIIEAMKVMNLVKAPRNGRIKQILVADGSPVEYGEILMLIEPTLGA